ncbi:site-specific integrase [Methylobacterium frigidaeris]|uniref:site-specific integrase n=1 Tax=Methylobacterium frigidaeris TaxID=2038277 RepID=UPI0034D95E48
MTDADIELWLDALAAERGTAASSLKTYRRDVACYLGWLDKRRLADVTRHDMVAYPAHVGARRVLLLDQPAAIGRQRHSPLHGRGRSRHQHSGSRAPAEEAARAPAVHARGRGCGSSQPVSGVSGCEGFPAL